MKLKKLLTLSLACALCVGATFSVGAANLDLAWYAEQNPDVVAALGDSPEMLQYHYEAHGRKEGRMANTHDVEAQLRRLFDAEEYAAFYPDVKKAFGDDAEAMFQHYISYGMLEARRPCKEVSYEAAVSLKKTVTRQMKDAGLDAAPGSAQLVEIITGSVSEDVGGADVQQALSVVAVEVEKAVAGTIEEAKAPKTVEEPGNDDHEEPAAEPTAKPTAEPTESPAPTEAPTEVTTAEELKAALENTEENGTEIQMGEDIDLGDNIYLTVKGTKTLDLNGHTITGKNLYGLFYMDGQGKNLTIMNSSDSEKELNFTGSGNQTATWVCGGASLTLKEKVSLKSSSDRAVEMDNGGSLTVEANASITATNGWAVQLDYLEGGAACTVDIKGTVSGVNGLTVNGNMTQNNTITIDGGTVKGSAGHALYLAGVANTTIKGESTIEGSITAIEIRAGELTIEKGTIESKATSFTTRKNNGGTTVDGAALAVSQHCTRKPITVDVKTGVILNCMSGGKKVYVTEALVEDGTAANSQNVTVTIADTITGDSVVENAGGENVSLTVGGSSVTTGGGDTADNSVGNA